tara:strand:+ start:15027 stop:15518 length:492 start_codon:yes stop_codon:yes gene_type:complete
MVKMFSSKKIFHKSSNNKKPVLMTDNFSYNRNNNNVKILRNTKLDNKRRLLIAESKGGPYHLVERTINGNNKTNRAYKVSEESIPQFVRASVNSISNRKNIKKCSSMKKSTKKTLLNNKNNKGLNNVSLQKSKKKVIIKKKTVNKPKKKVIVKKKKVTKPKRR